MRIITATLAVRLSENPVFLFALHTFCANHPVSRISDQTEPVSILLRAIIHQSIKWEQIYIWYIFQSTKTPLRN